MSWTAERARVASLTRSRTPDDPDLVEARRNLKAERLAEHIASVVNEAPPLSAAQRSRLAALFDDGAAEPARYSRPAATLAGGDAA